MTIFSSYVANTNILEVICGQNVCAKKDLNEEDRILTFL